MRVRAAARINAWSLTLIAFAHFRNMLSPEIVGAVGELLAAAFDCDRHPTYAYHCPDADSNSAASPGESANH